MNLEQLIKDFRPLIEKLSWKPINEKAGSHIKLNMKPEIQKELFQELCYRFVELYHKYDDTRGVDFTGYIAIKLPWIAHNMATKMINQRKNLHYCDINDLEIEYIEPESDDLELSFQLLDYIERLSYRQRQVVELLYIQNMRVCDVADELGIVPQNVIEHRKIALAKLRRYISEEKDEE